MPAKLNPLRIRVARTDYPRPGGGYSTHLSREPGRTLCGKRVGTRIDGKPAQSSPIDLDYAIKGGGWAGVGCRRCRAGLMRYLEGRVE